MLDLLFIDNLTRILKYERDSAITDILRKEHFEAVAEEVSEEVIILKSRGAKFFESGDIIGHIEEDHVKNLGTVLDSTPNYLMIQLYKRGWIEGGNEFTICESEPLFAYDLQIKLLEAIKDKRIEGNPIEFFFGNPEPKKPFKTHILEDRICTGEKFELDKSQVEAVEHILSLEDGNFLLVIGPPGTGKTMVIRKAACELMKEGEKVLITSHTNRAVDNALEGIPVENALRIGRPEKILPHLRRYMLSYKTRTKLGRKLRSIEKEIKELKSDIYKLRGADLFFEKEREGIDRFSDYDLVKKELKTLSEKLGGLYKRRALLLKGGGEKLANEIPIIGSTLIKSQLPPLTSATFDTVFIDECNQASIALALLPMLKAKKWVLIGDHKQMLPIFRVVRSNRLQAKLCAFNYLLSKYPDHSLWLKYHYRSNSEIIGFSANYVYKKQIAPSPDCSDLKLKYEHVPGPEVLSPDNPVVFIDCQGRARYEGGSLYNEEETEICKKLVKALLDSGIKAKDIGIITPYKAQKRHLAVELSTEGLEVNTVDAFQGREKDVIIFSLTATKSLEFASNPNRLNVAFTRPKYKLIVIGNGESIRTQKHLLIYKFLEYARKEKAVYDSKKV